MKLRLHKQIALILILIHFLGSFESMAKDKPTRKSDLPESVGVATMMQNGDLKFQLRSIDHGMIAEALKIYKPNDPEYEKMIKHMGGIKRGQSKPIPPFED